MFPIFIPILIRKRDPKPGQPTWSLKERVWIFAAGAVAFCGIALAFWLASRWHVD